ncbi:heme utilization cystosolic carrier protein HutX, partial [Enterobacteriaceae bacterium ML5]
MHTDKLQTLIDFLATEPDGTVEDIAREYGIAPLNVIQNLPGSYLFSGAHFDTVWDSITQWGEVTTLVNNDDLILEFHGALPTGTHRHGYFN